MSHYRKSSNSNRGARVFQGSVTNAVFHPFSTCTVMDDASHYSATLTAGSGSGANGVSIPADWLAACQNLPTADLANLGDYVVHAESLPPGNMSYYSN